MWRLCRTVPRGGTAVNANEKPSKVGSPRGLDSPRVNAAQPRTSPEADLPNVDAAEAAKPSVLAALTGVSPGVAVATWVADAGFAGGSGRGGWIAAWKI